MHWRDNFFGTEERTALSFVRARCEAHRLGCCARCLVVKSQSGRATCRASKRATRQCCVCELATGSTDARSLPRVCCPPSLQGVMRSVGVFVGSVILMRLYGESMAV